MTAPGALPLEATLATRAAQMLIVVAASLRELVEQQELGDLDAESADKGMADVESDLRLVGRKLAEIRKLTKAAYFETLPVAGGVL